jgi:hypothetical protein
MYILYYPTMVSSIIIAWSLELGAWSLTPDP